MTLPDDTAIRQMDGPALTRLALALALAPTGFMTCGHERFSQTALPGLSRRAWRPHTNVTQARTLFFDISGLCKLYSQGTSGNSGEVHLKDTLGHELSGVSWGLTGDEISEAMALTRCACLARAAQLREEAASHG